MKTTVVCILLLVVAGVVWVANRRFDLVSEPPRSDDIAVLPQTTAPKIDRTGTAVPPPTSPGVPPEPPATATPRQGAPRADNVRPHYPSVTLAEMLRPNNEVLDPVLGMSVTYPEGWSVHNVALRWGENHGENTIFFAPPPGSQAVPSLYYRRYADGPAFDMTHPEATLRDMARQKEVSRSGGGQNDYKNEPDSFVFREFNGNPSLSYFATYSRGSEVHAEYFMRILGPQGYVMFFVRGPANDVKAVIPSVYQMGGTVRPP